LFKGLAYGGVLDLFFTSGTLDIWAGITGVSPLGSVGQIAIELSGASSGLSRDGYNIMSDYGLNDGIVSLGDMIALSGVTDRSFLTKINKLTRK